MASVDFLVSSWKRFSIMWYDVSSIFSFGMTALINLSSVSLELLQMFILSQRRMNNKANSVFVNRLPLNIGFNLSVFKVKSKSIELAEDKSESIRSEKEKNLLIVQSCIWHEQDTVDVVLFFYAHV